jgi:hypothetical protein
MTNLSGGELPALEPGEAYQTCVRELRGPHPDYERAQVCATLSLEETLRHAVTQVAEMAHQMIARRGS